MGNSYSYLTSLPCENIPPQNEKCYLICCNDGEKIIIALEIFKPDFLCIFYFKHRFVISMYADTSFPYLFPPAWGFSRGSLPHTPPSSGCRELLDITSGLFGASPQCHHRTLYFSLAACVLDPPPSTPYQIICPTGWETAGPSSGPSTMPCIEQAPNKTWR